jgi:Zinc knuckle
MTECFSCGQDDHLSYDCPNRTRRKSTPPAAWPSATAESTPTPQPPPYWTIYQRPAEEIADPHPWADQIRAKMGWHHGDEEERLRELARRQVAESRRDPLRIHI